jgi:DNA-binding NtrC family response regulator
MIVEPDPLFRRAMAVALDEAGFRTVTAADGADAVNCLKGDVHACAVVLTLAAPDLDVVNPAMDGRRFRAWLDTNLPGAPVIVLAVGPALDSAGRLLRAAVSIEKPVAAAVVAAAVRRVVGLS